MPSVQIYATGPLYGANLGPTGLQLFHVIGSSKKFGLEVDSFFDPVSSLRKTTVHGAFALFPREPESVYEINGIDLTSIWRVIDHSARLSRKGVLARNEIHRTPARL